MSEKRIFMCSLGFYLHGRAGRPRASLPPSAVARSSLPSAHQTLHTPPASLRQAAALRTRRSYWSLQSMDSRHALKCQ